MQCSNPGCNRELKSHWRACPWCMTVVAGPGRGTWAAPAAGPSPAAPGLERALPKQASPPPGVLKEATEGIIIDRSRQEIQTTSAAPAPPGAQPAVNIHKEVRDGIIIDHSQTQIITQQIKQEIKIPGKFSLSLISQSGLFPAYRATAGGRHLVAKLLPVALPVADLDAYVQQMGLHLLPRGIARYQPAEEWQGEVYLLREYCAGQSLVEYWRINGLLSDTEVIWIMHEVADLLLQLPTHHGSLRPENIFLDAAEVPTKIRLADFAISGVKEFVGRYSAAFAENAAKTLRQDRYCSVQGQPMELSERDAYSMGVIALESLGGNIGETQQACPAYIEKFHQAPGNGLLGVIERLVFSRRIKRVRGLHDNLIELMD